MNPQPLDPANAEPVDGKAARSATPEFRTPEFRTPEEDECDRKQEELRALEREVEAAERDLAALRSDVKAFEADYLAVLGPCFAEMELIQEAAEEAKAAGAEDDSLVGECSSATQQGFSTAAELKTLFRQVAKNLHPDLASCDDERRRRDEVMAHANVAYANGNEEQLRHLLLKWKADPDAVPGDDIGARLIRAIRSIAKAKNRIEQIKEEVAGVRRSDLYFLCQRAEHARSEGRDLLKDLKKNLEQQILQQRARVTAMQKAI